MSGSTIGGIAGGIIGTFFGAPQLGFMIGSMIGSFVDPDKVYGPRLTDAQNQTSNVGIPIPVGYGTFSVKGNIIWRDPALKEHKKKKRAGKGGPTQVTYTYTRSYAIGICEGPIKAIKTIKRNGKVVYEASATASQEYSGDWASLTSASRKFLQKCKIYLGDETQMPDPTIEAVEGVGNVPPHRGMAYIVVKDDDLTDLAGAVPQYDFVVVMQGDDGVSEGVYEAPGFGPWFPWRTDPVGQTDPRRRFVKYEYGVESTGLWFDTVEAALNNFDEDTGTSAIGGYTLMGWARDDGSTPPNYYGPFYENNGTWNPLVPDPNRLATTDDIHPTYGRAYLSLFFSRYQYGTVHAFAANSAAVILADGGGWYADSIGNTGSAVWRALAGAPAGYNRTFNFGSGPDFAVYNDVLIRVRAVPSCEGNTPEAQPVPDAPGYYVYPDGTMVFHGDCAEVPGTFKQLAIARVDNDGVLPDLAYTSLPLGPVLEPANPNYNSEAYWNAQYAAAVTAGQIQPGWLYAPGGSTDPYRYPQLVSSACECEPPIPTVARDRIPLASIVADLCRRSGLSDDHFDVSQLTDLVDGFVVATIGGADSFITPLSQAYFFDCAEWDAKIRFVKRGGSATFALTADDLAERDGDAIEETRVQEVELLRKTTVTYVDPAAGFTVMTQVGSRRASTVQALGESAIEIPVAMSAADAAKLADKRIKAAWGEPSKFKFELPYRFSYLTTTDVGTLTDKAGNVHRIRLMESQEDSGKLLIEASQDEQSAYVSNAAGLDPGPPTANPPGLIGGTVLALLNIPVLRDEDDQVGIYVAAAGQLPGWRGAEIQVSTDGGATGDTFAEVTEAATIGYTLSALAAIVPDHPAVQTVDVYLPDAPESVDYTTLLRYYNRAVIGDEIIQYQTVTDLGGNAYRLSGLLRNRYDTDPVAHAKGARFVLLDSAVVFVQAQQWMIGQALMFRAVSFGTSADAYPWEAYSFATARSQTEWKPLWVRAKDVGSDLQVSWIGRARLGVSPNPHHSQHFRGYRVTYTNGADTVTHDVTTTTDTLVGGATLPGAVHITVAGLNAITGAGPASEEITA